jgi:chorismate mutase
MNKLKNNISLWRRRIDRIDLKLVELLNRRAHCAEQIGRLKLKLGVKAFSPKREKEVMRNISASNPGPLSEKAIKRLFEHIIYESRSVEHITMADTKKRHKQK